MRFLRVRAELHHGGTAGPADYSVGTLHVSALWGVVDRAVAGEFFVGELAEVVLEGHWVHGWAILDGGEGGSVSGEFQEFLVVLGHLLDLAAVA